MSCLQKKITELIDENEKIFFHTFLGKYPSVYELLEAEKALGFPIPKSYIWFLTKYGHGGCFFEFLGYGLTGNALFVKETLAHREKGLPQYLLIIENCDEYVICIHSKTEEIISWSEYDNSGMLKRSENFYQYFFECIQNAIENYD